MTTDKLLGSLMHTLGGSGTTLVVGVGLPLLAFLLVVLITYCCWHRKKVNARRSNAYSQITDEEKNLINPDDYEQL